MINFHNAKSFCENFTAFLKCIAGFVTSLCSAECGLLRCCLRLPLSVRFCYMPGVVLARLPFRGSIWAVWHAGSACFGGRHGPFCVVLPVLWRYCLCFSVLCLQPQAVLSLRKMFSPRPCLAVSLRRLAGLRVVCGSGRRRSGQACKRRPRVVPRAPRGCCAIAVVWLPVSCLAAERQSKPSCLSGRCPVCRAPAPCLSRRLLRPSASLLSC